MCQKMVCSLILVVLFVGVTRTSADLVGYWPLDGDGTDASGNGLHGSVNGTVVPTSNRSGSPGSAMQFGGGPGDYVEIGDQPELQLTGAITLSAWVMLDSSNTNNGRIVSKIGGPNARSWSLNIEATSGGVANPAAFMISTTGAAILSSVSPEPLPTDEWVHMAGVYQPDEAIEVYVNSDLMARGIADIPASQFSDNGIPVRIGNFPTYNNCGWLGAIDEVRIYDHAMSVGEIRSIMAGVLWPYAFGPDPACGALHEDTWVNLSWKPGQLAVSHDVYLGDEFDVVNEATRDSEVFRGNQTDTSLVVGFPGFAYPDGLVPGTTYYWRIDEVNDAEPNSPWKGDIWSFSIPPNTAYAPVPADDAEAVALDVTLSWTPGFGAKLHTVYFGDDFDTVSNASGGPLLSDTTFTPTGLLELAKTYYWRVDEFNPPFTYEGDVWNFRTEGTAANPNPAKGAVDVSPTPILTWTAGNLAASHEVYFGENADAVANATAASPEYKGTKALGEESYETDKLDLLTTYYWRIDEVNSTQADSPWIGNVWNFTTGDFLVVDDFESYNDIDPPDPNSNRIFDSWIDGFGTLDNGALVGNDLPPYAEQTIVHDGAQSMIYRYDNANKTSEATLTLVYPRDWTEEGVTKLVLWFRGASGNAADRMYVALNGNAVVYHDNTAATQKGGWNQWVIDLAAFTGVNLTNVNTITIGIGTKGSPAAGGTGTMYFDDIRLIR